MLISEVLGQNLLCRAAVGIREDNTYRAWYQIRMRDTSSKRYRLVENGKQKQRAGQEQVCGLGTGRVPHAKGSFGFSDGGGGRFWIDVQGSSSLSQCPVENATALTTLFAVGKATIKYVPSRSEV